MIQKDWCRDAITILAEQGLKVAGLLATAERDGVQCDKHAMASYLQEIFKQQIAVYKDSWEQEQDLIKKLKGKSK